MRKKIISVLFLTILPFVCFAKNTGQPSSLPYVNFDGEKYLLEYSVVDANHAWLNEYVRKGDNINSFVKLIALRTYGDSTITTREAATSVIRNLNATNPQAKAEIFENETTGDVVIDFFTWAPDGSIMEFNVFRFSRTTGSLVSLQFAFREYKDRAVMQDALKNRKKGWTQTIGNMQMPQVQRVIKVF
jgi:hypothetical protein